MKLQHQLLTRLRKREKKNQRRNSHLGPQASQERTSVRQMYPEKILKTDIAKEIFKIAEMVEVPSTKVLPAAGKEKSNEEGRAAVAIRRRGEET